MPKPGLFTASHRQFDLSEDCNLEQQHAATSHLPAGHHVVIQKVKKDPQEMEKALPPVLRKNKPFLFAKKQPDLGQEIAKEVVSRFLVRAPDAVISFVSGHDHFHEWKQEDFRSALQTGIVKLLNVLDLLVIDDGLNYGLTRLIGSAIRSEEQYRNDTAGHLLAGPRKPPINYFAVVPFSKVAKPERFLDFSEKNPNSTFEITSDSPDSGDDGFELSRNHSHYILVDHGLSYSALCLLRIDIERHLQSQLAELQAQSDDEPKSKTKHFVPHVVFLFQGGLDELDRVQAYLTQRTPVIVMDGCGGMADVLASCLKSRHESHSGGLRALLRQGFPELRKNDDLCKMYAKTLLQIRQTASREEQLIQVVDTRQLDAFGNLDVPLLKAAIYSSAQENASSGQYIRNFLLCISCNRPEVATNWLMNTAPWLEIRNKWTLSEFTYPGLKTALIFPGRESFVEILLEQRFPLRFLTSHFDLLELFQKAPDKDVFFSVVWEELLGHTHGDQIEENFILRELNPLIYQMTGIREYLDIYELSRVALTRNDDGINTRLADDKSLRALTVYAILLNRSKLAKIFLKYSPDPVARTIFVETMYRSMYRAAGAAEMRADLKKQSLLFGQIAADIVDAGIKEAPHRARFFFQRKILAFNNKTMLEMAFDARNRTFIANPHVQNWMDHFGRSFIRVKGSLPDAKVVLSALLIFPMYIWLSFPAYKPSTKAPAKTTGQEEQSEPETLEETYGLLKNLRQSVRRNRSRVGQLRREESYPPFPTMLRAVWSAPIVKFWISFVIYLIFLVVIGVDMMSPACTNLELDIAVFTLTALKWLELVLRTITDCLHPTKTEFLSRFVDVALQAVFNILFFLYRIYPYRYQHPFAGRVILALGVMYYYYSVWHKFFVFTRWLGPPVRICMIVYRLDLSRWLVLMIPFVFSTAVIWQSLITPDFPFTGDASRRALLQAIATVFGTYYPELEYKEVCEATKLIDWSNFTQPAGAHPEDRCWVGDYTDYTCPTVSVWSYFFEINYFFFLKLGMMVVIVSMFTGRVNQKMGKALLIWRYRRYQVLLEYFWRTCLPFPLNILGNIFALFTYFTKKGSRTANVDPEMQNFKVDTSFYWQSTAAAYFAKKEQEEAACTIPEKQTILLAAVKSGIQSTVKRLEDSEKTALGLDHQMPGNLSPTSDSQVNPSPRDPDAFSKLQQKVIQLELALQSKEEENARLLMQIKHLQFLALSSIEPGLENQEIAYADNEVSM